MLLQDLHEKIKRLEEDRHSVDITSGLHLIKCIAPGCHMNIYVEFSKQLCLFIQILLSLGLPSSLSLSLLLAYP